MPVRNYRRSGEEASQRFDRPAIVRAAQEAGLSKPSASQQLTPEKSLPLVSVIVPVFNHEESLIDCLRALESQEYSGTYEVIVVNNGTPGELDALSAMFTDVVFIDESAAGSYNARNAGVARANGTVLAFTDADCTPDKGWISNGVRPLLADSACGLVGGRVQVVPGNPQRISTAELFDMMFGLGQKHYVTMRHFAATANMLTRKDVIQKVGSFRGDLRSGGDAEWGGRVFAAGYSLVYQESAIVCHPARNYHELIKKMRRTVAGARDLDPDWISCLLWCAKRAPPPRHAMRAVMKDSDFPIAIHRKIGLIGLATFLRWRSAIERLWLQLGGRESPRS